MTLMKNRGRGMLSLTRNPMRIPVLSAHREPKDLSFLTSLPPDFLTSVPPQVSDHNDRIHGGFLRRNGMGKKIRTWMILSLVGAALACGQAAVAQQEPDWSKVQIKTTKVSGNIYMLEGQGGNIAASVGEDGIVIVDDQFAPLAGRIQDALKKIGSTANPHYHRDHPGGNGPFRTAGSTVIAQDNVPKRMEAGGLAGNGGSVKMETK